MVEEIDEAHKTIMVVPSPGGLTPPLFSGGGGRVHTKLRQRMREILAGSEVPAYLDQGAQALLTEARAQYRNRRLAKKLMLRQGNVILLLTWLGDAGNEALACFLRLQGLDADPASLGVEIERQADGGPTRILAALRAAAGSKPPPLDRLLADVQNLGQQKWDWLLPEPLLRRSYASLNLDLAEATAWLAGFRRRRTEFDPDQHPGVPQP